MKEQNAQSIRSKIEGFEEARILDAIERAEEVLFDSTEEEESPMSSAERKYCKLRKNNIFRALNNSLLLSEIGNMKSGENGETETFAKVSYEEHEAENIFWIRVDIYTNKAEEMLSPTKGGLAQKVKFSPKALDFASQLTGESELSKNLDASASTFSMTSKQIGLKLFVTTLEIDTKMSLVDEENSALAFAFKEMKKSEAAKAEQEEQEAQAA